MMKVALLVFIGCFAFAAARTCQNPKGRYGSIINNPRAYKCPDGSTGQCVSALFELCGAPYTGSWRKEKKVIDNCGSIPANTPIATFQGSGGHYEGHAAIFLRCDGSGNVVVADQWCGKKFGERTMKRNCGQVSNCANYFYTVTW